MGGGVSASVTAWEQDERAMVLGYIDGYMNRFYLGINARKKALLAT